MKKIIALALAVMMALSLVCVASAEKTTYKVGILTPRRYARLGCRHHLLCRTACQAAGRSWHDRVQTVHLQQR